MRKVVILINLLFLLFLSSCDVKENTDNFNETKENNISEQDVKKCNIEMNKTECETYKGIWHSEELACLAIGCPKPTPEYCECEKESSSIDNLTEREEINININNSEELEQEVLRNCNEDSECIKVDDGCCGCSSGGGATVINRNYENYWNEKLSEDCGMMGCITVMSGHWTCFATPECVNNKCILIENKEKACLDRWATNHEGIRVIKFANISELKIEETLKGIDKIEPKLGYRIKFPLDIYTFNLPKEKTEYTCRYDYIWCYVEATDKFINHLNKNENINAFASDYETISVITNNQELNKESVLDIINSYNDIIQIEYENISVKSNYYGFYVLPLVEKDISEYICNTLENNDNVVSIEVMNIWLQEIYETIGVCTNRESFFPIPNSDRC